MPLAVALALLSQGWSIALRSAPVNIEGAWALSHKWRGFMGVALVIKSNQFKYWFCSDAAGDSEPQYPITGLVEFDADAGIVICSQPPAAMSMRRIGS
jgi:hypothetical protein